MNPSAAGGNSVYEETADLFDWGFAAAGKVKPVGELVPPKSADTTSHGSPAQSHEKTEVPAAAEEESGGGFGTALAVTGGALAVLSGGVFAVNRRWPRRPRSRRATGRD